VNRIDVVAAAAQNFVSKLRRHEEPQSAVDSTLPETAQELKKVTPFEQKTLLPKGVTKNFVNGAVERVLTGKTSTAHAVAFLTATERDYVLAVLDEVYRWAGNEGFDLPNHDQSLAQSIVEETL
jgi:hypothetical protein